MDNRTVIVTLEVHTNVDMAELEARLSHADLSDHDTVDVLQVSSMVVDATKPGADDGSVSNG